MANGMRLRSRTALRDAMTDKGWSVRRLAARAGCGKSIIGLLRSGARNSCSSELAAKIAAALEVPTTELFPEAKDGGTD